MFSVWSGLKFRRVGMGKIHTENIGNHLLISDNVFYRQKKPVSST